MRTRHFLRGGAVLVLALGLGACSVGVRQSPAADEDTGHIHSEAAQDKPSTYTTQAGDTLQKVSARPDIYGDPDLWPLIQDANSAGLKDKGPASWLDADMTLAIPRDAAQDVLDAARARARQVATRAKEREPISASGSANRKVQAVPAAGGQAAARTAMAPAAARMVPSPVAPLPGVTPVSPPVPVASGSRTLPLVLLLTLVVAALGAMFYVFSRRDKKDFE